MSEGGGMGAKAKQKKGYKRLKRDLLRYINVYLWNK